VIADTLSRENLSDVPPERKEFQVNMLERTSIIQDNYIMNWTAAAKSYVNGLHELYAVIQV
jgi:hypothetical protein